MGFGHASILCCHGVLLDYDRMVIYMVNCIWNTRVRKITLVVAYAMLIE